MNSIILSSFLNRTYPSISTVIRVQIWPIFGAILSISCVANVRFQFFVCVFSSSLKCVMRRTTCLPACNIHSRACNDDVIMSLHSSPSQVSVDGELVKSSELFNDQLSLAELKVIS